MTQSSIQAVVSGKTAMDPNSSFVKLNLFNPDGTPFDIVDNTLAPAAAQADSTAATIADLKTDFNALLAKLRAAGHLAT